MRGYIGREKIVYGYIRIRYSILLGYMLSSFIQKIKFVTTEKENNKKREKHNNN
jgi:hypothetical protein